MVRRASALPIVPLNKVEDVWADTIADSPLGDKVTLLMDYVTNAWIEGPWNPEMWNHFGNDNHRMAPQNKPHRQEESSENSWADRPTEMWAVCSASETTAVRSSLASSSTKTITPHYRCQNPVSKRWPLCVWEPHRGTGVNILFENGQYPHNSSYEAPCLPWGATREVDDGILAVE